MNDSPAVLLYDANGNPLALSSGDALGSTKGLAVAGSDGTNFRFLRTANDGTVRVDPSGTTTQPVSPQLPVPNATDVTGTITVLNGAISSTILGYKSLTVVLTGSWTATVVFEMSSDGGATWIPATFAESAGALTVPLPVLKSETKSNGTYWGISNFAATHLRVRASEFTTGTINIRIVKSDVPSYFTVTQTGIVQTTTISEKNSSTTNLLPNDIFTGLSDLTLGVAAIQVNLMADQVCNVTIEQSMDGVNWDISDSHSMKAGKGEGWTIQATASYFRVLVQNLGNATTSYFRLQTVLCPIVEVLPRSLGQKLKEDSLSVTVASNQSTLPVHPEPTRLSINQDELLDRIHIELCRIRTLLEILTDEKVKEWDVEL